DLPWMQLEMSFYYEREKSKDQIRAVTLMSLGWHESNSVRERDAAADLRSPQYGCVVRV
ncbi:Serine/threonine-protein kinase edr1, partial [Sarracenia purpurea var. burkii]